MRTIRNINVDEALVIDQIAIYKTTSNIKGFDYTAFIPADPRQPDIDIIYMKNGGYKTIQVKGSRSYSINSKFQLNALGPGNVGWITVPNKTINSSSILVDYFIFVTHTIRHNSRNKIVVIPEFLIIPSSNMKQIVSSKSLSSGKYYFHIYFDLTNNQVLGIRNYTSSKKSPINLTQYWNAWNLL